MPVPRSECQVWVLRPRPAVCSSARNTAPSGVSSGCSPARTAPRNATELVESACTQWCRLPEKIVFRTRGASFSGNRNSGFVTNLFPRCRRRRGLAGFHVEINLYFAANHCDGCGFADSIVLPVDGEAAVRAQHLTVTRVERSLHLERQINFLGNAVDGQSTVGHIIIALLFDGLTLEGDLGIFLHVKIIGRTQVLVALGNISVYAGGFDGHIDGGFRDVLIVKENLSVKIC